MSQPEILYKGHKRNLIRIPDVRLVKMSDKALKGVFKSIQAVRAALIRDGACDCCTPPHYDRSDSAYEKRRLASLEKVTAYHRAVLSVIKLRKYGHEPVMHAPKKKEKQSQLRRRS